MAPPRRGDLSPEEKDLLGVIATGEPGPSAAVGGSAAPAGLAPVPSPPRRGLARLPPAPLWAEAVRRRALSCRRGTGRVAAPAGLVEPGRPPRQPRRPGPAGCTPGGFAYTAGGRRRAGRRSSAGVLEPLPVVLPLGAGKAGLGSSGRRSRGPW